MGRGSSVGGGVKAGQHWRPSARREVVVAKCQRIEQGHSEGGRALECVRGVNDGEGRVVAWPGGEAAAGAVSSGGAARQAAAQLPCSAFECWE